MLLPVKPITRLFTLNSTFEALLLYIRTLLIGCIADIRGAIEKSCQRGYFATQLSKLSEPSLVITKRLKLCFVHHEQFSKL